MSPCDYAPNAQNKVGIIQTFSARIYVAIVKLDAGHDVMFLQIKTATNKKIGDLFVLNSYKHKLYIKMLGFSKEID